MAFDPMADLVTGTPVVHDDSYPTQPSWTPFVGDSVAPYIPAWALECACGNTGFATGTITEGIATLAKAGWQVFNSRVLCPPCVSEDA